MVRSEQTWQVAEIVKISLPVKQHLDSHSTRLFNLSPLPAPYQGLYAANIRIMNKNLKLEPSELVQSPSQCIPRDSKIQVKLTFRMIKNVLPKTSTREVVIFQKGECSPEI
jgi:hypothetical protein